MRYGPRVRRTDCRPSLSLPQCADARSVGLFICRLLPAICASHVRTLDGAKSYEGRLLGSLYLWILLWKIPRPSLGKRLGNQRNGELFREAP